MDTSKHLCRILIVEDDRDLRESLLDLLMEEGYQVDTANGGADAVQKATTPPLPQVVLLDLGRPEMSGWKVLETLRARPFGSPPKIAILTSDPKIKSPSGVVATLRKPFPLEELMEVLVQCCQ